MIIHSYENTMRADACIEYLRGMPTADAIDDVILLPIPSTRDNYTISNTKVYINDVIEGLKPLSLICGYGLSDAHLDMAFRRGALALDLARDEDFLLENAELTALCALGIFLGSTRYSPREVAVGVVGYGRIGKRLTNLFLYLGSRVTVFTSREDTRLELCEYGVASAASAATADLSGLNLLINTAPAPIFPPSAIPAGLRVIELASGDNFSGVEVVEKYPSIPAKMFPYSAGRAWGRAIERFIARADL